MKEREKTSKALEDFGVMTEPYGANTPTYNLRALFAYCNENGRDPEKLTEDELKQFQTN